MVLVKVRLLLVLLLGEDVFWVELDQNEYGVCWTLPPVDQSLTDLGQATGPASLS